MPIQNDFLTFAAASDANVMTQAEYAAASATDTGYTQGVASSAAVNKTLRQTTLMAAVIAQFIVDNTGEDAVDDGTTATLLDNLKKATAGRLLNIQTFTASGTYTPTPGTGSIIVEGVGGGASGGGSSSTSAGQLTAGGGGGGGAYAKSRFTAGFAGLSVTIGAGGAASSAGGSGVAGGTTSLGALVAIPGGSAGVAGVVGTVGAQSGFSAAPTGGNILQYQGESGYNALSIGLGGQGGGGPFGNGAWAPTTTGPRPGVGYGSGSAGTVSTPSSAAQSSAPGRPGILIIYEYS